MSKMRKTRRSPVTIAIVGDGYTEKLYFEDYKNTVRPKGLKVLPKLPGKRKDGIGILHDAVSLKNDGINHVVALIDMDVIKTNDQKQLYLAKKRAAADLDILVYL